MENNESALKSEVGGNHYKEFQIQPIEFIERNKLGFSAGNVIKYVCRYKHKNGKEDLIKAKDFIDMLIASEYGE